MSASAAPGDVDPGFNPNAGGDVFNMAMQPDGRIVIGGSFTSMGGVARNYLARLYSDGTLDSGFDPNANQTVYSTTVQADGKIVIGGSFTSVGGSGRSYIARLNTNGTVDTGFNPGASSHVFCTAVQTDGKILLGGNFTAVASVTRNYIARLNTDGTLDTGFNPNVGGNVLSMVVQPDGRVLLSGDFTTVGGVTRNRIARVMEDGALDAGFNADANSTVRNMALQVDGKIVIGGSFTSVNATSRTRIARLNADGTVDPGFDPVANDAINSSALQADGKIVIGGNFTSVGGGSSTRIARLNTNGALDTSFVAPSLDGDVHSTVLQADGRVLIGGYFTTLSGTGRSRIARLENSSASQTLSISNTGRVELQRGGTSPETHHVTFDLSTDGGTNYTLLGAGTRISGGWELTGLSLPANGHLRARSRVTGGTYNGSSGLIQTVLPFAAPSPGKLSRPVDFASGLRAWWKMDETSGTRMDSSGAGNHLTSNNNVGSAVEDYWATGERSADFERDSSQYLSIANGTQTGLHLNGSYTVSMWVKLESLAVNALLFGKWQSNQGFYGYVGTGGKVEWYHDLTSLIPFASNTVLSTGKWHHLTFSYDTTANTASLYVDGNLDKTTTITQDASINALDFRLGLLNVEYFDGMMKDVAVWDRPLTSVEVKSLASGIDVSTAYRPGNVSVAPTAWWKLDELSSGTGAVARADSAGTHTLTDNNTVQTDGGYLDGASADLVRANSEYFTAADSTDWTIGSGDASVSTWVRFETMAAGTDYPLFCHTENGSNYWVLNVAYLGGRHWLRLVHAVSNTLTIDLQADWQPVAGAWYHVTWAKQGTQHRFYVDGRLLGSAQTSAVAMNDYSGQIVIGRVSDVGLFMDGRLADMAFWKGYALSSAEIKALATALPVQRAGIVSYWPLDEANGTRSDLIGTNHLTPVNVPTTASGVAGTAASFQSSGSQLLSVSHAQQSGLDALAASTIIYWAKPTATGALQTIVCKTNGATSGYGAYQTDTGRLRLNVNSNTWALGSAAVTAGAFYQGAVQYDGNLGRTFVNGALDASAAAPSIPAAASNALPFTLGAQSDSTFFFDGQIDEVIIARRWFRDEEVKALYVRGLNGMNAIAPADIVVEQPAAASLTDGTATVDFGSTALASGGVTKTFTIRNTGELLLSGLSVAKNGANAADFTIDTSGMPTTLAAGSSTTFAVTFSPAALGNRVASVQIASNDADENPFDIALSGVGTGTQSFVFISGTDVPVTSNGFTATGNTINLSLGHAPTPFSVFTVVNNTSASPISGTFTNLAQGQTVTLVHNAVSYMFSADYFGGDGNDLVLVLQGAGVLDYSFNASGKVKTAIGSGNEQAWDVAVQTDGKVVAAGWSHNGSSDDFAVVRYNADGSLDTGFGTGGKVTTSLGNEKDQAYGVEIQTDGKIVVAGLSTNSGVQHVAVVRYNANGTLDTSFDGDGKVVTPVGTGSEGRDVALQSDGKIVVGGDYWSGTDTDFILVRYNTNGSLDSSFGTGGIVTTAQAGVHDEATGVALAPDGKIVLGGYYQVNNDRVLQVARYQANGALDTTFSGDGIVTTQIGASDFGNDVVAQNDGKILLAGRAPGGGGNDAIVARYNSNGTLDTSFDSDGLVGVALGSYGDYAYSVAQQWDGKILLAGITEDGVAENFMLARLHADGSLDTSFAGTGKVSTSFGATSYDHAYGMALQPDGKIVLAGLVSQGGNADFAVTRYLVETTREVTFASASDVPFTVGALTATGLTLNTTLGFVPAVGTELTLVNSTGANPISGTFTNLTNAQVVSLTYNGITYNFLASYTGGTGNDLTLTALAGALDATFSTDGMVTTAFGGGNDAAHGMAAQPDGRLVLAGSSSNGGNLDIALARYHVDGTLDTSFGTGGKVTTAVGTGDDVAYNVVIQSDGRIVVAGAAANGGALDFAVVRYNANGTLDTTFNGTGKVLTPVNSGDDNGQGVAIQSDGKILVSGWTDVAGNIAFAAVRYNANGTLDTSFNSTGKLTLDMSGGTDIATSVVALPDGKILLGGIAANFSVFAIARLTSSGALDTSFDSDGKVTTGSTGSGSELVVQPDGKLLVAGYTGGGTDYVVARYTSDGALDTGFGSGGIVTTDVGGTIDGAQRVAVASDGKIIVSGYSIVGQTLFSLVRYNTDGSLDTSFNGTGKVLTAIGSGNSNGRAMTLLPDGSIAVAGDSHNGSNTDFAVARYTVETTHQAVFASASDVPLTSNGINATGRTLNLTLGFAPSIGTELLIFNNTSSSAISGTFTNIAHGATVPLVFNAITYNFIANYSGGTGNDLTLLLHGPGGLDYAFNGSGKAITAFGSGDDSGRAVAVQADGKVVLVGESFNGSNTDFALARYNANGTLDTSFDGDGKVTTAIGSGDDVAYAVAVQNDGKIVVAGGAVVGSWQDVAVARYNSNGSLDTSFNGTGKVTTPVGSLVDEIYAVAIQPDGKIVVAGTTELSGSDQDTLVLRYNSDGTLDTSFNTSGKLGFGFSGSHESAKSIALQPDGKIVLTGNASNGSYYDIAVARLNANGTLDTSFNGSGKRIISLSSADDVGQSVVVQPDGKILLVANTLITPTNFDIVLMRLTTGGGYDTSFGGGAGYVTVALGPEHDLAESVRLQADGKILVGGESKTGGQYDVVLLRFNTDGTPDTTFHGTGQITTPIGASNDYGYSMAIQDDGKFVVGGYYFNGSNYDFTVLRYLGETTHDAIFVSETSVPLTASGLTATGRTLNVTLGFAPVIGTELLLFNNTGTQPISGTFTGIANGSTVPLTFNAITYNFIANYTGGTGNDLTLLLPGPGGLDYTFNGSGRVVIPIGSSGVDGLGMVIQADGKVVMAGKAVSGNASLFALTRQNTDGTPDTGFGTAGKVTTDFGNGTNRANAVIQQADGKLVAAGYCHDGSKNVYAIARYSTSGALDSSFGSGGKAMVEVISGGNQSIGYGIAVQADGKLLVTGLVDAAGGVRYMGLVRLNANGTLDATFGTGGKVTTRAGGEDTHGAGIAVQGDGRIVVSGGYWTGSVNAITVMRYNSDGSLDNSFGSSGVVLSNLVANYTGQALALQSDGGIVVAGYNGTLNSGSTLLLARYTSAGVLDTTFSDDGRVTTAITGFGDMSTTVAVQPDGKTLLGGYSSNGSSKDYTVARYNTDGSLDTSFHGTGATTVSFGSYDDLAWGIGVAPDGKIVLGGQTSNGSTYDFGVVRLLNDTTHPVTFTSANDVPLNANGINVTGQTVDITLGFVPTAGTVLTVVNNTGTQPITGTFTGLANGQLVPLSFGGISYTFLASYSGGTGNDLTLTAVAGALDPAFNVTGKRLAAVSGTENDFANDVAIQADGKIVSVGYTTSGNLRDFLVLRHNADGAPDSSFGTGGVVTTSMVSGNDAAAAVAIQGDGKIVVVGQADLGGNNTEFAIARYNTNGTLDSTFDGDGKLVIALASEQSLNDVVIQPDGKIVAAGYSKTSVEDMTVLRLNANGSLDTTFDGDGMVSTNFGHSSNALSVFVMADGRILAGGGMSGANLLMARYTASGALDTTFDTDGKVSVTIGGSDDFIRELAVDSAGRIVVAGESFNGSKRNVLVGRFTSSGALDTAFGGTGLITQSVTAGDDICWAMSLQLDGKIVIGGVANYANGDFLLMRYLASGTLDSSFGAGGILTAPIGSADDRGIGLAIQNDGKIVLVGASFDGNDYDAALARFQVESSYTAAFASASDVPLMAPSVIATGRTVNVTLGFAPTPGTVITVLDNTGTQPISGAFTGLANGQLVPLTFGGITYSFLASYTGGTGNDLTLTALGGALDYTFNGSGKRVTAFGAENDKGLAVVSQPDGKVIVAGASSNGSNDDFALARYNADGTLDGTFGTGGKVTTAIGSSDDQATCVALQSDGKIVAAGESISGGTSSFALVRYNADGTLDTSFGTNGKMTATFGTSLCLAQAVLVQPDGRIVAAGFTDTASTSRDIALLRCLPNGTLDTSFGTGGKVVTAITSGHDYAYGIAQQSDGKIVVSGAARSGAVYDFAVLRYNASGALDTSFGVGTGVASYNLSSSGDDAAQSVIIQPDGRILAGGYAHNGSSYDFGLLRLLADGTLDTSFGGTGKVIVPTASGPFLFCRLALQANGKILAAGDAGGDWVLTRLLPGGSLDSSFQGTGIATVAIGSGDDRCLGISIQPGGKVLLAGQSHNGSNYDFAVARFLMETTHSTTFATAADVPLNVAALNATGQTVSITLGFAPPIGTELRLVNNTGANLITGTFTNIAHGVVVPLTYNSVTYNFIANYSGGTGNDLTLLLPGPGGLDYTFNGSGRVTTVIGSGDDAGVTLAVQSDGKLVVAGSAHNGSDKDFALLRHNPDGSLDLSFNGTGKVITPVGTSDDYVTAIALDASGRIVATGSSTVSGVEHTALVRYLASGALDTSFGGTGKVTTVVDPGYDVGVSVAIQNDGRIVVLSEVGPRDFALLRYNVDGSLDSSFGTGGKVIAAIASGIDDPTKVLIQPDGKIVALGRSESTGDFDFSLVRYNANGSLDTSFGIGGKVITPVGDSTDYCYDAALQPDGKMIAVGPVYVGGQVGAIGVVRYLVNGGLDTSFGTGGKVVTPVIGSGVEHANAKGVAIQSDGKIIVSGWATGTKRNFAVLRYSASGVLDPTFRGSGIAVTAIGDGGDECYDVAIQPDGRIVLAGISFNGSNYDFAVARLTVETTNNVTFASATDVPLNANGFDATGRTLNVTLNFTPAPGTSLKVFDNTSLQPIGGEFVNLAHGQTVTLNYNSVNYDFVANYFGGDGNDLVLEWANTKLAAFGANESAQLGITGTAAQANVPTQVVATAPIYQKTILSMSAGEAHSLAVCSDGTVAAWGSNVNGQLGNGTTTSATTPVTVTMSGVLSGKKVIAVAAGGQHSVALCSDGTLAAWGDGSFGQLGDGGVVDRTAPVLVSTAGALSGKRVIAISAGATHSAALCSDGTVVCWGDNANGELGNANNTRSLVPVAVSTSGVLLGRTVVAIACGQNHTLALLADGAVAAWGLNASKQLGNNSTVASNVPVLVDRSGLLNGKQVVQIAAGGHSSLARCSDGVLAAWGLNDRGQLGVNSATTTFGLAQAVDLSGVLSGKTITGIELGQSHAAALCSDGSLATWGAGTGGQLGNNATSDSLVPVAVNNAILGGTDFFVSAAGGAVAGHTLALIGTAVNEPLIVVESPVGTPLSDSTSNQIVFGTTLPGTVKTRVVTIRNTGTQTLSGLGVTITGSGANPSNFSISTPPAATLAPGDASSFTLTFAPGTIGSKTIVLEIASNIVGTANPFSIGVQGTVLNTLAASYTTGLEVPAAANGFSAGGKTVNFSLNYAPPTGTTLMVVSNTGAAFISGAFSNLAHGQVVTLTFNSINYNFVANYFGGDGNDLVLHWATTRLLAWGANSTGTLGNNSTAPALTPVAVTATGVLNGKTILSVASGERHSLAVCSDGALAAWGANNAGQLGDGTNSDRLVPVLVSTAGVLNGKKVIAAAAGYDFSIALCSDGTLVTFGANSGGQLGNNSTTPSNVPVTISSTGALSGKAVVSIAAGYDFGLASCADGTVVAWGQNAYGQFGNNTINNSLVPVATTTSGVLNGKTVRSVAAGNFHSLAICTDGTLAGWGDNSFGELGDGTNDASLLPVLVTSSGALVGKTPVQIAASMLHSAALCSDGTVVTWGDNSFGQLGLIGLESSFSPVIAASGGVMNGRVAGFLGGGQMHHVISVTDGYPAAWGDNSYGQLGNGVTSASFLPVAVSTTAFGAGERMVRVSTGSTGLHSLGIVAMPLASGGAPVVSTNAAESINKTSATLKGLVNPGGTATTAWFEHGLTTSYGSVIPVVPQSVGSGSASQTFTQSLTGLEPNTPYHFRIIASNTNGTVTGDDFSFTTLPDPPLAVTTSANTITNTTATLTGTVNPTGRATTIYFEFGTTTLYGNTTSPQNIAAGSSNVNVIAPVSGLTLGTTYHFRLVAENSAGTAHGDDLVFTTTSISAPTLTLLPPDLVTTTGAALKGSVNPNGALTNAWFEYGLTTNYTGITSVAGLGAVTSPQPVSLSVASLTPATTYHYRLVAQNSAGTTHGTDETFTTLPLPPIVETQAATAILESTTSARLNGTVRAQNGSAAATFEWGTDGVNFPNSLTATQSPVTGDAVTNVSVVLTNLLQFTTYHFRVRAESNGGNTTGGILTFQPQVISGLLQQFPNAPPASNGSLAVTLAPAGILSGWRFVGEHRWRASGDTATGLVHGSRMIEFRPVPGYLQPGTDTVNVTSTGQVADYEYYATPSAGTGGIHMVLKPDTLAQAVNEAERGQWRLLGETTWRDSATTASSLPAGSYLVECKAVSGYSTPVLVNIVVSSGQTVNPTIVYADAFSPTGTPPVVISFSTVSTDATKPYGYVGQIRSHSGLGTGFAVKSRVVATAAHVVFDEGSLSSVQGLQWLPQVDAGGHEPLPATPRGYYLIDDYASVRATETPGSFSLASRQKDVAALYFINDTDAARTGFAGFLASDLTNNEFLISNAQKMLVGYPVDGIAALDQGRMHATPAANLSFTGLTDRVFATTGIRSTGGNSGGPLCVQHTNGNWYPAAIYLGGATQSIVRAIDSAVIQLFDTAQQSGIDDQGYTGGGITHSGYTAGGTASTGALRINITPAGTGWRPVGSTKAYTAGGNTRSGLTPGTFFVEFTSLASYQTPANQSVQVIGGGTQVYDITYLPSITPQESWRQANFGSTANSGSGADAADPDLDGLNNLGEYTAGTNPNSAADVFKVQTAQKSGSTFTLTTAGKSGRTYILERNATLGGAWDTIASQGPLGSDATVTLTDPSTLAGRAYYRIRVTGP